jgi:hypothetical protein
VMFSLQAGVLIVGFGFELLKLLHFEFSRIFPPVCSLDAVFIFTSQFKLLLQLLLC